MLLTEALQMAGRNLWGHKMRSTLTILGVVIGIAVVVAITSMAQSFENSITGEFDDIDDRSIFVSATINSIGQGPPDAGQFGTVFTEVDRDNLLDIDGVERVDPAGNVLISGLRAEGRELPFATLSARTPDDSELRDTELYYDGSPFADGDQAIVMGWDVARFLGDGDDDDPGLGAGDTVTVTYPDGTTQDVTIAGILAKSETLFGSSNGQVYAPLDPFYDKERESPSTGELVATYDGFTVIATEDADVNDVRDEVKEYMENDSDAAALTADVEDLEILVATASDITDQISAAFDQFTAFFAGIAAVSLVVAAIMIATIMLISVTERRKEIGVMKAIGGLDGHILLMFLLEAAIIGLIGSIIGVALGSIAGLALVEGIFADQNIAYELAVNWLFWGVVLGMAIGIIAGVIPARSATKVQPVEALSYE